MNQQLNTIRVVTTHGDPFDCEDCGTCYPEGLYIQYNNDVIWEKYADGHTSGNMSEDTIVNTILNKWYENAQEKINASHTEEKRIEWNKKNPGNAVARTTQSWLEDKEYNMSFMHTSFENLKRDCDNLPYNEARQVKMIALWLEEESGEEFLIEVDSEKHED